MLSEYNVLLQKHSASIEINWGQGPSAGGAILSMHNFGSVWSSITRLSKCLISSAESCPISLQVKTVRSPPVYKLHLNPSWKLCTDLAHFRFWPCLPVLASCELVLVVFSCFCPFYVFLPYVPFWHVWPPVTFFGCLWPFFVIFGYFCVSYSTIIPSLLEKNVLSSNYCLHTEGNQYVTH